MPTTSTTEGLEDIIAVHSGICDVDGTQGTLAYYGVDIHDLARFSSFEETTYLLWYGTLPTQTQLDALKSQLCASRTLPREIVDLMRIFPPSASPMDVLRTTVSALSAFDPDHTDSSLAANQHRALSLTARIPAIVTGWNHIRNGRDPIAPLPNDNHATNFLYMLTGKMPDVYTARVLDMALVLYADHELNASTFAARVAAGTQADIYAAITSAISALSGPLHGGAIEQVIHMLLQIGDTDHVESYLHDALERKERIMGFGHRVYHTGDPRATHLRTASEELGKHTGDSRWYEISHAIEVYMQQHKHLNANVDFYSPSIYYMMGIPIDLGTPIFASTRIAGWVAHVLEQYAHNRLIRPRAEYVGPKSVPYVPLEQRG